MGKTTGGGGGGGLGANSTISPSDSIFASDDTFSIARNSISDVGSILCSGLND